MTTTLVPPSKDFSLPERFNVGLVRDLLDNSPPQKYYTYPAIEDPRTGVEVKVGVPRAVAIAMPTSPLEVRETLSAFGTYSGLVKSPMWPYDTINLTLRQQYQQILHSEWSPEIPAIIQAHRNLSHAIPQQTNLHMKEENVTGHLRQFVITGKLPEFAFPGSHRLELFMLPKDGHETGGQIVNSISVLARADPDECASCRDRRAAGSQIRGNMYLDPRIVLHLLSRLQPDQRAAITELDHLSVLIRGSLGVRMVKPDGTNLAAADPPAGTHHTPLEEAKAPKLTLHSQVMQVKPDAATVKIGHHMTHGTFREKDSWRVY